LAVPWGSLQPARPRVLPTVAYLGGLTDNALAGIETGRNRRYEEEAPDVFMAGLDAIAAGQGGRQGATLGNLAPQAPRASTTPFNGMPTQANNDLQTALTPGSPTFDGNFALRRENAAQQNPAPQPSSGMEAYRGAITNIESGGRYDLLGPVANSSGDRAYGRYQVMGANVGPWTEEALGYRMTPQQFLADPAAQDAVFDHVFGGYVDRYGPEGAARAWFTGSPTGTGTDVLGTTADAYVAMFNGGQSGQPSGGSMPSGGGGGYSGGGYQSAPAWSPPNAQEHAALRAMIANPLTREQGIALATQRMTPPGPVEPIEINGQLVDPRTGRVMGDYRDPQAAPERQSFEDQNGVRRFVDTGEPMFPGVQAAPEPLEAPVTRDILMPDGQVHIMGFNPATGQFDTDQGLADPGGQWGVTVGADGTVSMQQGRSGGAPTAAAAQAQYLYGIAQPELPIVEETFPALTELGNQIAARGGDATYWATSPEYQRASNALRVIIQNYLYSVTGAAAPQGEVDNWFNSVMPRIGESAPAIADKLQRVRNMIEQMRVKADGGQTGAAATPAQPAAAPQAAAGPAPTLIYDPTTNTLVPVTAP
jgi:hypothetical protein